MGRYLDALKKSENGGMTTLINLKNPPSPSILGLLGSPPPSSEINQAANDPASDARHFRWLIHFPDRDPVETTCLPEPTHAEVLAFYPDAVAAIPIPCGYVIPEPGHVGDLRTLVRSVSTANALSEESVEALVSALRDPVLAL